MKRGVASLTANGRQGLKRDLIMAGTGAHTVLVIDDDPLYRQTLQDMLTVGGYRVVAARDGAEGLAVIARDAVDLVVCDLLMPVMEGIETIIALRRSRPQTKIIAVSGGGNLGIWATLEAARGLGADATLAKPIRSAELLNIADSLLGLAGA